jgi:CRP/FNR family transcriptional regulator, cyclic AMP receptor protein
VDFGDPQDRPEQEVPGANMRKDRFAPDPATIARLKELSGLSDKEVRQMAETGRLVHLPESWTLIHESTPADAAYYLLEGEVSVRRHKEEVATVGPGTFIGEAAIMNHALRSAAVVTKTNVTALNFTPDAGRQLTEDIPAIREAISAADKARLEANQGE